MKYLSVISKNISKDIKKYICFICLNIGVILANSNIVVNNISLPVIVETSEKLPLVSLQIVFQNSGSVQDGKLPGLAALSAGVLNEGTSKLGSTKFANKLESKAISINTSNGKETFVIEVESLSEYFDDALGFLEELLNDKNLKLKTLEKLKLLSDSTISSREDDFDYVASKNLYSLLYKGTYLANPTIGTKESIAKISLKDIEKFYKENLTLDNVMISFAGDLKKYEKKIAKILSSLPLQSDKNELKYTPIVDKPKDITIKKDTEQAYVYFASKYNLDVKSEDLYKAKVAFFILSSSGFGSRLMEEIRVKKGLAYSVYGNLSMNLSHSLYQGHLQTKLESSDDAIKSVKAEIAKFVKNGVTKEELESAKKFILGSEPLRNETIFQRLNTKFSSFYKGYDEDHHEKELRLIEKLSLDNLNTFIKEHKEINELYFSIVTK
ncbi:MAG: Zinc protease-like protein [uncultured Campylobacterales bacterium]|uniref:Zinc protease-like protein n=1 Tax=uncultured Campylobacterales bacterium TaxID=352960 RepID=A0A6S6SDK7_9BACT|nr:MAG: Zinc protease-like protein [uncultured Campylobacterales bacterium]